MRDVRHSIDGFIQGLLEALTVLGAIGGGVMIYSALFFEASAPQQGALAAMAVALVAIPYCLATMNHQAIMRRRLTPPD